MEKKLKKVSSDQGIKIFYAMDILSTNDFAKDPVYSEYDIIIADNQTKGRGQRGNVWESNPGQNLTFSMVVKPCFLPAYQQFLLSEAVSLAVIDTLAEYGIAALIKWPNDIYVGADKIAGILIENDIFGSNLARSVIGIGLNVNQQEFSTSIANPISMKNLKNVNYDRVDVLSYLIRFFKKRYEELETGEVSKIRSDYHNSLFLLEEPHLFKLPGGDSFVGTIKEVRDTGELLVERQDGSVKGFLFKEIEF